MDGALDPATFLPGANAAFDADSRYRLAMNAVTTQDPKAVLLKRDHCTTAHEHNFSVRLSKEFKATSQKASGRCWIFACLNVLRHKMLKKYELPDTFELSQTFVFFYDKLERCNYLMEQVIATAGEPLDGRRVQHLLTSPLNDGGQWDMLVNVIQKYGLCPKSAYGDSWSSSASRTFNGFLTCKLREWAEVLRAASEAGADEAALRALKGPMLTEAHRILVIHFGKPPTEFEWTFHDTSKAKTFHRYAGLTPLAFAAEHVPYDIAAQISLVNDPRNPYYATYTVEALGNVHGGADVLYVNLPVDELKLYALEMLRRDEPVWFGCDVGKFFHRKTQVMDTEQFDYDLVFGSSPGGQSKEARLRYGQSLMTHAMCFSGADVPQGAEHPTKWRVENSWGEETGNKGYALMTDAWFNEFMYQVVVDRACLGAKAKAALEAGGVTSLPPWDPMGALAR